MSAYTQPFILFQQDHSKPLERLSLQSNGEGQFNEKWLQTLLFKHPESLPIKEINPSMGRLIPICMEIETGAGPADILYVTETGQVVLVETKLWRNPEARREVVAQILDYAKQLTEWTFDDLARQAAIASGNGAGHLLNILRTQAPGTDEAAFVDGINLSLKTGDFLLLIAGDGIRYGAESLVGFIERYGNLKFGLGLIEVAVYKADSDALLLQPRILAKTEILHRTVLIGASGPVEMEDIAKAEDSEVQVNPDTEFFVNFWTEFYKTLKLDDATQPLSKNIPRSTNAFFSLPPSGSQAWISAYVAQSSNVGGVYLTFLKGFEKASDFYEILLSEREEIEKVVGTSLNWSNMDGKIYISVPTVILRDLSNPTERNRVITYLTDYTNRMINAFRPRLEALSRD